MPLMAFKTARAAIRYLSRVELTKDLKPLGFVPAGSTFRRERVNCVQVLNVQSSQTWNTVEEGWFTLNAGVYFPDAHAQIKDLFKREPGPAGPMEYECTVRRRFGKRRWWYLWVQDVWWKVQAGKDVSGVFNEVRLTAVNQAVSWLDRVSDPRVAYAEFSWDEPNKVAIALMLGEIQDARRMLRRSLRQAPRATSFHAWGRSKGLLD
jgi:hypothetical protein